VDQVIVVVKEPPQTKVTVTRAKPVELEPATIRFQRPERRQGGIFASVASRHNPAQPAGVAVTAKAAGKRLKTYVGETVRYGNKVLVLKSEMDKHDKVIKFYVEAKTAS
jgi:hypothetical protein